MDKLEEHIRKNREELDNYSPSREVWNGISKSMRSGKLKVTGWLSAAAMIVVILTTSVLFYKGEWNKTIFLTRDSDAQLMKTNPQVMEAEIYYNSLFNSLYSEATPLLTTQPEIKKELFSDLSQLDSLCADIKKDLKDNVDNQNVIEALIKNYRIKTEILEDMLDLLKQNENDPLKNNSHAL
ncbi:MAG: hypothetical protein MUC93_01290 [Bacteroidales bacterium]|jgi:hypothetical protein|nr:hypothetical protein [Bacteroidales bacterium]